LKLKFCAEMDTQDIDVVTGVSVLCTRPLWSSTTEAECVSVGEVDQGPGIGVVCCRGDGSARGL